MDKEIQEIEQKIELLKKKIELAKLEKELEEIQGNTTINRIIITERPYFDPNAPYTYPRIWY